MVLGEDSHKDLTIIACVEPLVLDAQLCLALGDAYQDEGFLQEALQYYERAERGFIRARQRWDEILESEWPPEFTGLKNLVTTRYDDVQPMQIR